MIALCEDNERDMRLILDMLDEWGKRTGQRTGVRCFSDAESLLDAMADGGLCPDLLLMDIYFDGRDMTGIDAVRELRKVGLETAVVFLTTSCEHSLMAFDLDARQYLVKPVEKERLFRVLDRCGREPSRFLLAKQRGGAMRKVLCSEILYCETRGNDQNIHLNMGETVITRRSSTKMREILCVGPEFVNLGPSYIINLLRVVSLEGDSVLMEGGKRIQLSHKRFLELRKRYFDFFSA